MNGQKITEKIKTLFSIVSILIVIDISLRFQILADFIQKIPATFWGVIVGAFFTLIGVMLSNHHDREIKKVEREHALRREIYLGAIEPISMGLSILGRLCDLDIAHEKLLDPLNEKSPAIAKANLIADVETSEALTRFQTEFGSALLRLSVKRIYLTEQTKKVKFLSKQIDDCINESKRVLEMQKESFTSGVQNKKRDDNLQILFKNNDRLVNDLLAQRTTLNEKIFPLWIEFTRECYKEIISMRKLTTPLLACVRKELNFSFDIASHERILSEADTKIFKRMEEFIMKISDLQTEMKNSQLKK